ncbi:hypothetical protein CDAR_246221 [Caerostris darwini]|uniref:Uncharacterized protein n=1 Tax=Caerostris darwini TaxID=1538125 RepID=A0AAV4WAQ0_9ARAC|nr:hypothetical protein CDAR_246221 [Caerostris darwini]
MVEFRCSFRHFFPFSLPVLHLTEFLKKNLPFWRKRDLVKHRNPHHHSPFQLISDCAIAGWRTPLARAIPTHYIRKRRENADCLVTFKLFLCRLKRLGETGRQCCESLHRRVPVSQLAAHKNQFALVGH